MNSILLKAKLFRRALHAVTKSLIIDRFVSESVGLSLSS